MIKILFTYFILYIMDKINLSEIKGIVFDLDGVIFDVTGAIKKSIQDAVEKYKIQVNIDDVLQEMAHLIEDLQHYPIPKIILNSYDLLKVQFLEGMTFLKKLRVGIFIYNQFNKYKQDAKIFEGIAVLISKLSQNIKLAILTNNKNTHAEEVLKKFDLNKYFEMIVGFNEVTEVKPSPEGINLILDKWNIKPSEAVFIGDMSTDILAGKAANVKMVCVASGLAQKEDLLKHEPDILVNDTQELIKVFI